MRRRHASHQRGLTLVELMVGLAIGLFIVATALGLAMGQLHDDRSLLAENRLSIDLRAVADLVTRDLRRAGYRGDAGIGIARIAAAALADPYAGISWSDADATLLLNFSRDTVENQVVDSNEQFGFRLRHGVIDMMVGGAGWQAVTDPDALVVTAFSLTPVVEVIALGGFCEQPCPATQPSCPRQQIRRYDLVLAARSATVPTLTRTLATSVRVRADLVTGTCPA